MDALLHQSSSPTRLLRSCPTTPRSTSATPSSSPTTVYQEVVHTTTQRRRCFRPFRRRHRPTMYLPQLQPHLPRPPPCPGQQLLPGQSLSCEAVHVQDAAATPSAQPPPPPAPHRTGRNTATSASRESNLTVYRQSSRLAASAPAPVPAQQQLAPPQIPVMLSQSDVLLPRVPHNVRNRECVRIATVAPCTALRREHTAWRRTMLAVGAPGSSQVRGQELAICEKQLVVRAIEQRAKHSRAGEQYHASNTDEFLEHCAAP